jgi:hypothetical protein
MDNKTPSAFNWIPCNHLPSTIQKKVEEYIILKNGQTTYYIKDKIKKQSLVLELNSEDIIWVSCVNNEGQKGSCWYHKKQVLLFQEF